MSEGVEQEAGERRGYVPRRKNDPAGVRARILDAAYDLFQSRGYSATSVHEIAGAARVTGGALHHHFATKKAIGNGISIGWIGWPAMLAVLFGLPI